MPHPSHDFCEGWVAVRSHHGIFPRVIIEPTPVETTHVRRVPHPSRDFCERVGNLTLLTHQSHSKISSSSTNGSTQARISTTFNRSQASRYFAHFARLLPAVKCSVFFFPIAAYGMMYHSPTGITHTAKKSTVPFLYCFLPGPITFKLYSFPRRQ